MKYRIIKDEFRPAIYQAQKFEDGEWVYIFCTTTFSHRETEKALQTVLSENENKLAAMSRITPEEISMLLRGE